MKKIENTSTTILVEILGVGTILLILFLTFLPKAMSISINAKRNAFTQSLKEIETKAVEEWEEENFNNIDDRTVYRIVDGVDCVSNATNKNKNLDYELVLDNEGKVIRFRATNGNYQYDSGEVEDLKYIRDIQLVSSLKDNEKVKIICDDKAYLTEKEKNEQKTLCVIEDNINMNESKYNYSINDTFEKVTFDNGLIDLNNFYSRDYMNCIKSLDKNSDDFNNSVNICLYKYENTNMFDIKDTESIVKDSSLGCYSRYKAETLPSKVTYVVNHYKQKLGRYKTDRNDRNYELTETEKFDTNTGTSVTPKIKDYIGYYNPKEVTVKVEENNTIINYYYDRMYYKVRLNGDNGIDYLAGNGTYHYGEEVVIDATPADGHKFNAWYDGSNLIATKEEIKIIIDKNVKLKAITE